LTSSNSGFDNPPSNGSKDEIPKSLARVLFAEQVQKKYKERKQAAATDGKKEQDLPTIRPNESLKTFSRRAEMVSHVAYCVMQG
jgi:hypothetical protein